VTKPDLDVQGTFCSVVEALRESATPYAFIGALPVLAWDVDDVESILEARAAAGDTLDWSFLDRWAEAWGIEDRLEPYRERFRP
jgi:hypothetical protein